MPPPLQCTSLSCPVLSRPTQYHHSTLGMLVRQCRAGLSTNKRLPHIISNRALVTNSSLPRTSSNSASPQTPASLGGPSQTLQYAQVSTPPSRDEDPLLSHVSYHAPPGSSTSDLPGHLEDLRVHLAASLLPLHQPLTTPPSSAAPQISRVVKESEDGSSGYQAAFALSADDGLGETVIGVVSPFEGGDCYNRDAVLQTAGRLGADVVRIDLALAIGLSDSLGIKGVSSASHSTTAHSRCASAARQEESLIGGRGS
jgi:hypothetical protein